MSTPAERSGPTSKAIGLPPPKRRPRSYASDRATWAFARLLILSINAIPEKLAIRLGIFFARLMWKLDGRHRKQILRHMDIAFRDEFTKEQKAAWCKANFEHVGRSVVEFARQHRLTPETMGQYVDLADVQIMRDLLAEQKGKGILCVPGHHGN